MAGIVRKKLLALKMLLRALGLDVRPWRPQRDPLFFLKQLGINTILDIGANEGQFAQIVHKVLPDVPIFSFEPLRFAYERLCQNMKRVPNFTAFNFAIGDTNGDAVINKNKYSQSSSFLPLANRHAAEFPHAIKTSEEKVTIRRLDDVAKDIPLTPEILLKMDVQGYETLVLAGGVEVTRRSRVVLIEVSFVELYKGQQLFHDIYETMRGLGFSFHGVAGHLTSKSDGRYLSADAIFLRDQ